MRNKLLASFVLTFGVSLSPVLAEGMTRAQLLEIARIAGDDYAKTNPEHAEHITGFKVWKSADDGKVKLYIDHSGMPMEQNYTCHNHDGAFECHAQ